MLRRSAANRRVRKSQRKSERRFEQNRFEQKRFEQRNRRCRDEQRGHRWQEKPKEVDPLGAELGRKEAVCGRQFDESRVSF